MKTFILICSLMLSFTAMAEMSKEDAMKKMEEASKPGPEQKALSEMAGRWTYTSRMWESATAAPQESKGSASMKMIMGGRILQQDVKGTMMGKPFNGMGFTSFDNLKREVNTVWMDSMSTAIMTGKGTYDAATKTITDSGTFTCPMEDDMTAEYRSEMKMIDKNNMTFTMYGKGMGQDKNEFKMMELIYKRAK